MRPIKKWLIYGATGETGSRIVRQAALRGHQPVLLGRSEQKLRQLAARYNLHWQRIDLNQPLALQALMADFDVIVNAANPFGITRPLLLEAALATRTHYLDLANDMDSVEQVLGYDNAAKQAQVCVMSGIGFGSVASGCLMQYLHSRLPAATDAEIIMSIHTSVVSPGLLASSFQESTKLGTVFREGMRYQLPIRDWVRAANYQGNNTTLLAAPMGDLQAAYIATAIPNINLYLALDMPYKLAKLLKHSFNWVAGFKVMPDGLSRLVSPVVNILRHWRGADVKPQKSSVHIRLQQEDGKFISASLVAGDGNDFTAQVAVLVVEQVGERQLTGAMVPGQVFDSEFVLQIDGVMGFVNNE